MREAEAPAEPAEAKSSAALENSNSQENNNTADECVLLRSLNPSLSRARALSLSVLICFPSVHSTQHQAH